MMGHIAAVNEKCDICKKKDDKVWDYEITIDGVQLIRFNAHKECKDRMFKLLKQG